MADILDVETALTTLISGTLYPNGTGQASVAGVPCRIAPGWPNSTDLDAALAAGKVTVSVYVQPNMERVTTRYNRDWEDQVRGVATITAAIAGRSITLGGTVTVGQYVTALVNEKAYSYAALTGNTLSDMATALAALIATDYAGTAASGAVITLSAVAEGLAMVRIGAQGTVIRELKRQDRGFQIVVWAPTPLLRSQVGNLVDVALAATDFLDMPDHTKAWLRYRATNEDDNQERAGLYRRDLFYWCEFATTEVATGYPITAFGVGTQGQNAAGDLGPIVTTSEMSLP